MRVLRGNGGVDGEGTSGVVRDLCRRSSRHPGSGCLRRLLYIIQGWLVLGPTALGFAAGDYDGNGYVDLGDYREFQLCFGQPAVAGCAVFDANGDGWIDDADVVAMIRSFTGPPRACSGPDDCNDRNVCTSNACVGGECVSAPLTDGTACADNLFCDGEETCQIGLCMGGGNPCQADEFCHEATRTCPPARDNLILNVAAGSDAVTPGDTVILTLDVANLSEAVNGVQALLRYNDTVLSLIGIVPAELDLPPPADRWAEVEKSDNGGDVIWAAVIKGDSIQDDGSVATITFLAIAEGKTTVVFLPEDPPLVTMLTSGSDATTVPVNLVNSGPIASTCDDGLFCNGTETLGGGSCHEGTDPCGGQPCDEVNDVCSE